MDFIENRVNLRKSEMIGRLGRSIQADSGESLVKSIDLTLEDFNQAKESGVEFFTRTGISKYQDSARQAISNAYLEESKEEIRKSVEAELISLVPVIVHHGNGAMTGLYVKGEDLFKSEDGEALEKGKRAAIGEIREWSGKKYQKTATGWVPVKGDSKDSKKNSSEGEEKTKLKLDFGVTQGTIHAEISAKEYLDNKEYLDENYDVEFEDEKEGVPVGKVRVFEKDDYEE